MAKTDSVRKYTAADRCNLAHAFLSALVQQKKPYDEELA
jgi:hypothetical protein